MTRIVFMGTPDFSVPILTGLMENGYNVVGVVTQPDRPAGRKKTLAPTPVKAKALEYGIPVFQPDKIKENFQQVLDWVPDLIITAAFGQMVPKVLLDAPRHRCINIHASLLPKYRGGAPIHQAVIDGETQTGITIQYMDVTMDTGDIISHVVVPIGPDDHTGMLFEKLSEAGIDLLLKTLPSLLTGESEAKKQNHALATFAKNITREQERIDWQKSAAEVYNQVRGLHPWPVSFTVLEDGTTVKVWWGKPVRAPATFELPGTIVSVDKDGIGIACGGGTVFKMTDVQVSGKKRMEVAQFINGGHPFEIGKTVK